MEDLILEVLARATLKGFGWPSKDFGHEPVGEEKEAGREIIGNML